MNANDVFEQNDGKVTRPKIFLGRPGIYLITNIVTGKVYVGSAANLSRRIIFHRNCLRKGVHTNRRLQHSYNKHGASAFSLTVLEYVESPASLRSTEQRWMDQLNATNPASGYNIVPDSQHKMLAAETKALLSAVRSGRPLSAAHRSAIMAGHERRAIAKGKVPKRLRPIRDPHAPRPGITGDLNPSKRAEVRRRISQALLGHGFSSDTLHRMSVAAKRSRPEKWKTTPGQRAEIIEKHNQGKNFCELGREYGVSRVTIRNIVRERWYRLAVRGGDE